LTDNLKWEARRDKNYGSSKTSIMPSLRIPESAYSALEHLIHCPPQEFEAFLNALSKAEPSLDQDQFWTHVATHLPQMDRALVRDILHEILQMDESRSRTDMEIEEFAEEVAEALAGNTSDKLQFKPGDEKTLKDRLVKIFEGRTGLEISMKAMGVVLDQDRVFLHARILTDIRPVFNEDGDTVHAAVIIHNLRIHYVVDSEHKDFYVALDASDIRALREALDRAETKAQSLRTMLKTTGVSYLDAEE
jgi:hypothetical protein